MMAPKHHSSDAGNSDMPKRSSEVLPSSENVKVLYLMRKTYIYAEVLKYVYAEVYIHSKNKFSIHDTVN